MQEPSVLDYVKSKLAFWRPSTIKIPAPETDQQESVSSTLTTQSAVSVQAPLSPARAAERSTVRFPWLPVLPLFLALLGQLLLEPPDRQLREAIVLYSIAAIVVVIAYFRSTVLPASLPVEQPLPDNLRFHTAGLLVGLVLMLFAFVTFGASKDAPHDFNPLNLSLWLLSIGYLVWAFAMPRPGTAPADYLSRARRFLAQPQWNLKLTRWSFLLLLAVGLILFFRFYRLAGVPAEMVSDHAEKLLDVQDVLNGQLHVFFPRNTGREFFQFYWTILMIKLFHIPVSFMALKVGTVLAGLITLFYLYRLGKEIGNRWVALLAVVFAGVSYWANIMSRIGLRFPLYPLFVAPLMFYLYRGLRTSNRNDFIKAGLVLGLGLHGYTSFRIVPLLVVVAFALYFLHVRSPEIRKRTFIGLVIVVLISLAVFMPLFRYAIDNPDMFAYRSFTRLGSLERPLPGPAYQIFLHNTWNALTMFFWDDGDVWVHSITHRPALDVAAAALFFIGLILVISRYARRRQWQDLFMLVSIPVLLLPSILSLAFPNENPNLNRTAGAYVPVFLILGIGLEALLTSIQKSLSGHLGRLSAGALELVLLMASAGQSYNLLFVQYDRSFREAAWNATEMGSVVRSFEHTTGETDNVWVVAFPYWVDTRLVGIEAGHPDRDLAIWPDQVSQTQGVPGAKLFLLNLEDQQGMQALQDLYPEGRAWDYSSQTEGKDFTIFEVLPKENLPQQSSASFP